jgi:hypothetical protein
MEQRREGVGRRRANAKDRYTEGKREREGGKLGLEGMKIARQ